MISAEDVNPRNWTNKKILFDNDVFSVISGEYKDEGHCLGMRWNGELGPSKGFPVQGDNPIWFVMLNLFAPILLLRCIEIITYNKYDGWATHLDNILLEMKNIESFK